MNMQNSVLEAMKAKAPKLMEQLKASGEFEEYVNDLAETISSEICSLSMEIAKKQGYDLEQNFNKRVGILNSATQAATEITLETYLEFPQDDVEEESSESWTGYPPEALLEEACGEAEEETNNNALGIEYYDDWWDSDNYFVCINRHYIFAANRNDKSPHWKLINPDYGYWDAIHQRIYRNLRSDRITKAELPAHFPPPPDSIPPEAINPPPPPPPPPIPADKYPILADYLSHLDQKSQIVYLVLEEDLYDSRFGDGKFHFPEALFFDSGIATQFINRRQNEDFQYHTRPGLITLHDGILECEVPGYMFDHFSDSEILTMASERIELEKSVNQDIKLALHQLGDILKANDRTI